MKSRISLLLLLFSPLLLIESVAAEDSTWYGFGNDGRLMVKLWFSWSENCPNCQDERPVIEKIAEQNKWLQYAKTW